LHRRCSIVKECEPEQGFGAIARLPQGLSRACLDDMVLHQQAKFADVREGIDDVMVTWSKQ